MKSMKVAAYVNPRAVGAAEFVKWMTEAGGRGWDNESRGSKNESKDARAV